MQRKLTAIFTIILIFLLTAAVFATAGTQSDPVITLSYLTSTYQPYILAEADDMIDDILGASYEKLNEKLAGLDGEAALYASLYMKNTDLSDKTVRGDNIPTMYTVERGTIITGAIGTQFMVSSGTAAAYAPDGGCIVDTTLGTEVRHGSILSDNSHYMAVDEGSYGVMIMSDAATVIVSDTHRVIGVVLSEKSGTSAPTISGNTGTGTTNIKYTPKYTKYAEALKVMNLFKGTNNGFELDRSAKRVEAIVMLIRILGEESKALVYTGTHPFTDVPSWADRYVAYAYNMGYTLGTTATTFGSDREVTQAQYLTFILRALGYDDSKGDFIWSAAADKCIEAGVLTRTEATGTSNPFYRDQMAYCSYKALYANLKGSKLFLIDKLLSSGSVTSEMINSAVKIVS